MRRDPEASPALEPLQGETGFFQFQVQLFPGLTRLRPPVVGQRVGLASLIAPAPAGVGSPVGAFDPGGEVDVRDVCHFIFLPGFRLVCRTGPSPSPEAGPVRWESVSGTVERSVSAVDATQQRLSVILENPGGEGLPVDQLDLRFVLFLPIEDQVTTFDIHSPDAAFPSGFVGAG